MYKKLITFLFVIGAVAS
ncbi:Virulence protein, partial [Monkeypox virus]